LPSDHGRDEPVPFARDGLNESRLIRVIPEYLPDLTDRTINAVVGVEENTLAPDPLNNLFSRD
jgi:hypothetical protein